ncbi:hypothetical protein L218DRAFT_975096 [Marasmius fiardii PR-910]|nr:hypothetical protein L218DRAFT_975096 [Marasmius fiardii PR-910]
MPKPPIPEHLEKTICRSLGCNNEGRKFYTGCKEASPRTRYCSQQCQKQDWKFHKKYCGKKVYTFKIELLGSSNPVIKCAVDFHFVIQYAFGPWQQCHPHRFSYTANPTRTGLPCLRKASKTLISMPVGISRWRCVTFTVCL